mmetsp:Transcript_13747/g.9912  ORF Transcript_13747/g.9912 Transcript_13747/m.9912 type:complete len:98 (-) Transcript_13747:56-349(-)
MQTKGDQEKKDAIHNAFKSLLPKWLSVIKKILASNTSTLFLVGDSLTIADIILGSFVTDRLHNTEWAYYELVKDSLESFENLKKWSDNFKTIFAEYL